MVGSKTMARQALQPDYLDVSSLLKPKRNKVGLLGISKGKHGSLKRRVKMTIKRKHIRFMSCCLATG